tara:strand:- start:461 stop:1099 length:639 start_codon:yes stop_codon:yes gene_type:complete
MVSLIILKIYSNMIDKKEILKDLPDKSKNIWTRWSTSLKLKGDLIDFFGDDFLDKTVLEIGTHYGLTTRVLSFLFKKVITVDNNPSFIRNARDINIDRNNIEYLQGDIYDIEVFDEFTEKVDAVFIDAVHKYRYVLMDTINSLKTFKDIYLIYDDYGLTPQVRRAVDDCLELGIIEFVDYIGHEKGVDIKGDGKNERLQDREGIICKSRSKK